MVEALADLVAEAEALDAVLAVARSAPPLRARSWDPLREVAAVAGAAGPLAGERPMVVAGGPAFTFGYAETDELLAAAGARTARFDPVTDPSLPAGTAAVVIGGGFPEVYAEALSANTGLRQVLAGFDGPALITVAVIETVHGPNRLAHHSGRGSDAGATCRYGRPGGGAAARTPAVTTMAAIAVVSGIAKTRPIAPTRVRTISSAICPLVSTWCSGCWYRSISRSVGSAPQPDQRRDTT